MIYVLQSGIMILFKRDLAEGGSYGSSTLDLASAGGYGVLTRLIRGTKTVVTETKNLCEYAVQEFIRDNDLSELKRKPQPPYIYRRYSVMGRGGSWGIYENSNRIATFSIRRIAEEVVSSMNTCVYQFRKDNGLPDTDESFSHIRSEEEYIDAWLRAKKRGIDIGERSHGAKTGSVYDRRGNVVYTSHTVTNEKEPAYEYRRWTKRELPLAHLERRIAEWDKPLPGDWISGYEFSGFPRSKRAKAMVAIVDGVISMIDSRNYYDFDGWDSFLDNYRDFRAEVLANKDNANSRKLERYQEMWRLGFGATGLQTALFTALNGINDVAFAKISRTKVEPQIAEIAVAIYEWLGVDSQERNGVSAARTIVLNSAEKAIS